MSLRGITSLSLTSIVLLSACNAEPAKTSSVVMTLPEVVSRVRAVDRDNVSPLVMLNGDTTINMQPAAGREGYTGTITVTPNTNYELTVIWREFLPNFDRFLDLARVDTPVEVGEGPATVNIDNNSYRTDMDDDGDGVSNLQERINNTNPFDENNSQDGTTDGDPSNDPGNSDTTGSTGTTDASDTTGGSGSTDGSTDSSNTSGGTSTTDGSDTTGGTSTTDGSDTTGGTSTTDGSDTTGGTGTTDASDTTGGTGSTDGTSTTDGSDTTGSTGTSDGSTDGGSTGASANPTVVIPRISDSEAPQIDGAGVEFLNSEGQLLGEWANAVQFDNSGNSLHVNNLMIDINAEAADGTPYRRWAAMHDDENLYIVVLVDDDGNRQSDSPIHNQDDSLELFIDGDNSKLTTWGDSDDFHYIIPLMQLASATASNDEDGRFSVGNNSSSETLEFEFFTGPGIGPDGIRRPRWEQDVYELSIDLESAGIVPGLPFGLELQINDDDDGGARNSKWGWFHPSRQGVDTDQTVQNPSIMGTVVLEN
ncbi:MAG: CBM9 family sugar-binding protein [Gammaproteobacteria bacterium]|nr:CBM9 family sugar-binding protein [Gammaproteobacteria bacterium]